MNHEWQKLGNDGLPGTHLKKMLSRWFLISGDGSLCSCQDMASKMDLLGCGWCESPQGMNEILAAMKTNAAKIGVPYIEAVARRLVLRAVRDAARRRGAPK